MDAEASVLVTDGICSRLRDMIMGNELVAGQKLVDRDLAETLGVSRTPIREVLARLAMTGLIEQRARRGYYVARFSVEQINDLYDFRKILEFHAAGLAAAHATPEHHQKLQELLDQCEEIAAAPDGRLLREVLEETKEAVGDSCAVAIRFAVDELPGEAGMTHDGEGRAVVEMLAEMPDLWDVNVAGWPNDSTTSRFFEEGSQEKYVSFVKQVTTKPVVAVGRYTSVDRMVWLVQKDIIDFIGAARPSISGPFLPKKIEEGRIEDIRECIGCNICVTADFLAGPFRCTQNPTMGGEWRKGWHPEDIQPRKSDAPVLVVRGGPAGLEATRALGKRG